MPINVGLVMSNNIDLTIRCSGTRYRTSEYNRPIQKSYFLTKKPRYIWAGTWSVVYSAALPHRTPYAGHGARGLPTTPPKSWPQLARHNP